MEAGPSTRRPGESCGSCGQPILPCGLTACELEAVAAALDRPALSQLAAVAAPAGPPPGRQLPLAEAAPSCDPQASGAPAGSGEAVQAPVRALPSARCASKLASCCMIRRPRPRRLETPAAGVDPAPSTPVAPERRSIDRCPGAGANSSAAAASRCSSGSTEYFPAVSEQSCSFESINRVAAVAGEQYIAARWHGAPAGGGDSWRRKTCSGQASSAVPAGSRLTAGCC